MSCRKRLFIALLILSFVTSARLPAGSSEKSNQTIDLVSFLKASLKTPPDVEHFEVRQHVFEALELPPGMPKGAKMGRPREFYEGARSGSNFFLRAIDPSSKKLVDNFVVGRSAGQGYNFSANSLSFILGTNMESAVNAIHFQMLSHFLNFGLINYNPESLTWQGGKFQAERTGGGMVYGELDISNNLPRLIKLRYVLGGDPYRAYAYDYPQPPDALGGFPAKITVMNVSGKVFNPTEEITMQNVVLADKSLPASFFDPTVMDVNNVKYTNMYSNNVYYVYNNKSGKLKSAPLKHNPLDPSLHNKRVLLYSIFIILIAGPCLLWLAIKGKQTTNT